MELSVGQIVASTEAEGPGRRFALWVQGCSLRCEGCCNPHLFAERGGENLVAATRADLQPGRTYRLVTTDWVAKNARTYLGDTPPALTERPELKLKAAVLAALNR